MSSPDIIYTQNLELLMVQDIYNILNEKKQINPSPEDIEISNKNFNRIQIYQKTLKLSWIY